MHWAAAGFEAARRLDRPQGDPRSGRRHGHSFRVEAQTTLPPGWGEGPGVEAHALQRRLHQVVDGLDYADLNEVLVEPSDARLADWLRPRLKVPGPLRLHLWAGPLRGVADDAQGRLQVWLRDRFESAHRLPHVPEGHKCGRMHGHGFEVVLHALWEEGGNADLETAWRALLPRLHLACLNDLPGLEIPTSEMLSGWIWQKLKPRVPALSRVTIFETATCGAHFDGRDYSIWKDHTFDSATRLGVGKAGDPRQRLHGHTYLLRLGLTAPLDRVLGWTVDFGEVSALFSPVFQQLDHQPLHENLPGGDVVSILHWIRARSAPALAALNRIELRDTPGTGAILSWQGGN